jgi:hypothetical protein
LEGIAMAGSQRVAVAFGAVVAVASVVGTVQQRASAFPPYLDAWIARYPTSTIPQRMTTVLGAPCYTCHIPPSTGTEGSCYRLDIRERLLAMTIEEALAAVEWLDSDYDGVPNVVEIRTARTDLPGQVGYHAGLAGPLGLSPCGPTPTVPVTNQNETPGWCYANCDSSTGIPVLTANDFSCFLNAYAAGSEYANCDGSTIQPHLTANDFSCFLNRYASGCS